MRRMSSPGNLRATIGGFLSRQAERVGLRANAQGHQPTIRFRIPISPTPAFYSQVRFFNFALRRLGGIYESARIDVIVGDFCDLEKVTAENRWSEAFNIAWIKVPDATFRSAGVHGTANWRFIFQGEDRPSDIVIFSDADTVLLRDIDPILLNFPQDRPTIRGHMAHMPPEHSSTVLPLPTGAEYWPKLFEHLGAPWPSVLHRYSMDAFQEWPEIPAYFNYGFVAANRSAVERLADGIFAMEEEVCRITRSFMRSQISLAVLAARRGVEMEPIGAEYNTANDLVHMKLNNIGPDDIRMLHYLRSDEIDRYKLFVLSEFRRYQKQPISNPANAVLLKLLEEYYSTTAAEN
jgi:hypothetical protein